MFEKVGLEVIRLHRKKIGNLDLGNLKLGEFKEISKEFWRIKYLKMNKGTKRENIKIGLNVGIVLKKDQRSGKITKGVVKKILTNSFVHPHGIKVILESGKVGRVKEIFN